MLRELLDRFQPGDVFLGDCCFCSYFMLALLLGRGVDVVTRQHQRRRTDFRCGQRLGDEDHVVVWQRPARPEWMDEETYATIPETLTVRELKVRVDVPGFRVQELVVVTTLTDAERYPQEEIARLFRLRWHVELDLRNIKTSLRLDDLRGKTPEMVRREIWVHWLAYNLIRKVMAQAALEQREVAAGVELRRALAAVTGAWALASVADRVAAVPACQSATPWHRLVARGASSEPCRAAGDQTPSQAAQAAEPAARGSAGETDRRTRGRAVRQSGIPDLLRLVGKEVQPHRLRLCLDIVGLPNVVGRQDGRTVRRPREACLRGSAVCRRRPAPSDHFARSVSRASRHSSPASLSSCGERRYTHASAIRS